MELIAWFPELLFFALRADIRGILVIAVMFLASIVLMPTFWYLWIVAGSGNANFFYSGTLAYNLAHVSVFLFFVFFANPVCRC